MEIHSELLDQPRKKNGSALAQSGRMGPLNNLGQRTAVYDGLHKMRAGDRARADRRTPSQTNTATPRTRSFMVWQHWRQSWGVRGVTTPSFWAGGYGGRGQRRRPGAEFGG